MSHPLIADLGIDLDKTSCRVAGLDGACHVVARRRMHRYRVLKFASTLPPCVAAMEACYGAPPSLPAAWHGP
jgi:transposase